jgi:hypothetical protein
MRLFCLGTYAQNLKADDVTLGVECYAATTNFIPDGWLSCANGSSYPHVAQSFKFHQTINGTH